MTSGIKETEMKEEDLIVIKLSLISGGKETVSSSEPNVFLSPPEPQQERGHNLVISGRTRGLTWPHKCHSIIFCTFTARLHQPTEQTKHMFS